MRRSWQRLAYRGCVWLTALSLLAGAAPEALATSVSGVSVQSAPISTQASAQNGMVRVFLSSLGNPSKLTLTVAGSYSVNGSVSQSIASGSTLTVGFNSATGAITLTRNGSTTNMGNSFILRRHSASGSNGIQIAQARRPANPYPGDLSFRSVRLSGGSYKLYTVAHINIENYLYGVLPYEMGSGAHIEALKAQAVAARTYTVRMMANRSSGYYDVVDTTSDQVYNGTPSGNQSCVSAVNATKGIVLKYGSNYATAYYSASNGGQTESAQNANGASGYPYLTVKDDPFDYNNPDCTVKKATVYINAASSSNNASLMSLLLSKAVSALQSGGYRATASNTTITAIRAITPHTAKYASPSRLYTKMDFALTATTLSGAGTITTAPVTVTCGIFTELEKLLGMSIQASSNELWTVVKGASAFTLQARRYGHGLGMSQRGAMYMGKLGYGYAQILGFYYPGCSRVSIPFTNTILSASSSDTLTTVEDGATVEADGDGCIGIVSLVSSTASLAIRAEKSTSGRLLCAVSNNSPVTVLAADGTWCLVRFGSVTGYVPQSSLSITGSAPATSAEQATSVLCYATVTASTYLNLRASGSASASIVSTAPAGAVLTVFDKAGSWAHIQFGATVAYASVDFLRFSDSYPTAVSSGGSVTATVTLEDATETVNLRSSASTSSSILAKLPHGTQVTVTRDDGSWCSVAYNGMSGYIVSDLLVMDESVGQAQPSDGTQTPDGTGTPDGTQTPGTGGTQTAETTATVASTTALLREAADETSPSLTLIAYGQSVVVEQRGEVWSLLRYDGVTGYMLTASLSFASAPADTATALTAVVVTASGSLNLRAQARAGSSILTTIPRGAQVSVTSRGEPWSGVIYQGVVGFVMTSFLQFSADGGAPATPDATATTAIVTTASGSLNLRASGQAGSAILTRIPQYATISVLTRGAEWCQVQYQNTTGFVMSIFLTFQPAVTPAEGATSGGETAGPDGDAATGTGGDAATGGDGTSTGDGVSAPESGGAATPPAQQLLATVSTTSGSLNLRYAPVSGSKVVATIPRHATVTVLARGADWSQVSYGGMEGYAMTDYLSFFTQEIGTASQGVTAAGSDAWVVTASGSLNLRASASKSARVLLEIPRYAAVRVISAGSVWSQVQYGGVTGYVMSAYLSAKNPVSTADTTGATTPAEGTTTTGGTTTPTEGTTTPTETSTTPAETSTTPTEGTGEPGATDDANADAPDTQEAPPTPAKALDATLRTLSPTKSALVSPPSGALSVALRAECSESSAWLADLPGGFDVTVLERGESWCRITYIDITGYCQTAALDIAEE